MSTPSTPSKNAATGKSPRSTEGTPQKQASSTTSMPVKSSNSPASKRDKSASATSDAEIPQLALEVPAYFTPIERKRTPANSDHRASISTYSHSHAPTYVSSPASLVNQQLKKLPPLYTAALPAKDPNQREPGVLPTTDIVDRLRNPDRALYIENGTKVKMGWEGLMYICGAENFKTKEENGKKRRYVNKDTELYMHGLSMGVPKPVYDWLCSDPAAEEMVFDASIFESLD
ncbi:hypothetical protein P171DRAFT_446886 [Karstenula rhodostoma CBS 690.94]|uniref:Uncharacterized protein n=1 Tax=Karstenula rhodostoma CBS 690.94 TaxID=1392251 RepID=A0A9P4PDB4_9PLEO|nr:hypothetical protein P171DRAFT_446886 [Karstenula rhodostoma CBS 690.94]